MPLAAALSLVFIGSPTPLAASGPGTTIEARISTHVSAELERLRVPGAAVAVVNREGVAFAAGFGISGPDGAPVTAATPFQVASVSKLITAVAIMQLVETGRLRLNETVSSRIAWFGADEPGLAEVTVGDLLAHTSGFGRRDGLANWNDDADEAAALERNARRLAHTPPSHPIGQFEYSNANYDLLGHLVEVVSGDAYDEYLAQHVFTPLGMAHSYVSVAVAREAGLARGHYPFMGVPVAHDIPIVRGSAPSAFLMASAEDLGQLLVALLNGGANAQGRILEPQSVAVMGSPLVTIRGGAAAYAMGLRVEPLLELGTLQERRAGVFGYEVPVSLQHGGDHATYAAHVLMLPREGWGVATVMNLNDTTAPERYHRLATDIAAILLGRAPRGVDGLDALLVEHSKPILAGILGLQLWALRRTVAVRPSRGKAALLAAVPMGTGLGVAGAAVWLAAQRSDVPLLLAPRFAPDIGLLVLLVVLLGMTWGMLAPALTLRSRSQEPAQSGKASGPRSESSRACSTLSSGGIQE